MGKMIVSLPNAKTLYTKGTINHNWAIMEKARTSLALKGSSMSTSRSDLSGGPDEDATGMQSATQKNILHLPLRKGVNTASARTQPASKTHKAVLLITGNKQLHREGAVASLDNNKRLQSRILVQRQPSWIQTHHLLHRGKSVC